MAERRMFAKTIIDSDAFLDMPLSTQALYFHLSMRADDEGFINNPKKIQRMIGASDDDLKVLIVKNFIIPFESGIVVIKHWRIHNYIQNDRFKPTVYSDERSMLQVKENKAYTLSDAPCIQDGYTMDAQVSIGKDSIGKVREGKDSKGKESIVYYPTDEKLDEAFKQYIEHRKAMKKPLKTEYAIKLAMNNLAKLSNGDNDVAIEILNQSIVNGWQGLFELKGTPKKQQQTGSTFDFFANKAMEDMS